MSPVLWRAQVSTFAGVVAWARHFTVIVYGSNGRRITPEWRIDAATAEEWTADDDGFTYREGSQQRRFNSKEDAVAATVAAWLSVAGEGDMLLKGMFASASPDPILAEKGEGLSHEGGSLREYAEELLRRSEEIGWWDKGNGRQMDVIADEWWNNVEDRYDHSRTERLSEEVVVVRRAGEGWEPCIGEWEEQEADYEKMVKDNGPLVVPEGWE